MNMIYKKQGIGIALGIFVFAVSMVLMSGDGLFVSKVSAQGVNSTAAQEPADNMDQIIAKFKEIYSPNYIVKDRELRAWKALLRHTGCSNITPFGKESKVITKHILIMLVASQPGQLQSVDR